MKSLSLEQLEVESYATKPSEQELTDLKGGTGWHCWIPTITTVGKVVYDAWTSSDGGPDTVNVDAYQADSVHVSPGGGVSIYGGDSTKVSISH